MGRCSDSINGEHEVGDIEIESTNDETTTILVTCMNCESLGRIEVNNLDIDWTEEDDEDDGSLDDEDDGDEDEDLFGLRD